MTYTALLIFAGLQTIPKNLYKRRRSTAPPRCRCSARWVADANAPLVLVVTVIGSFRVFDTVQVATGGGGQPGGPVNASQVIYLYIYENMFRFNDTGYAAAIAVILFVILMLTTAIQLRLLNAGNRTSPQPQLAMAGRSNNTPRARMGKGVAWALIALLIIVRCFPSTGPRTSLATNRRSSPATRAPAASFTWVNFKRILGLASEEIRLASGRRTPRRSTISWHCATR